MDGSVNVSPCQIHPFALHSLLQLGLEDVFLCDLLFVFLWVVPDKALPITAPTNTAPKASSKESSSVLAFCEGTTYSPVVLYVAPLVLPRTCEEGFLPDSEVFCPAAGAEALGFLSCHSSGLMWEAVELLSIRSVAGTEGDKFWFCTAALLSAFIARGSLQEHLYPLPFGNLHRQSFVPLSVNAEAAMPLDLSADTEADRKSVV